MELDGRDADLMDDVIKDLEFAIVRLDMNVSFSSLSMDKPTILVYVGDEAIGTIMWATDAIDDDDPIHYEWWSFIPVPVVRLHKHGPHPRHALGTLLNEYVKTHILS
jgi:hypothetical protein